MLAFPKTGLKPKKKRTEDKGYILYVASLPCVVCKYWEETCVAHHCIQGVMRGIGLKASDYETFTLCNKCHLSLHAHGGETKWLAGKGLPDGLTLARVTRDRYLLEKVDRA